MGMSRYLPWGREFYTVWCNTKSRVKTLFSRKHTKQPCSAHCFSLALQQLLWAYTHFYLHWQYPLQTNLILLSSSHSPLVFLSYICADETEEFPDWSKGHYSMYRSPVWKKKTHTQPWAVCVRGKAFAAMKISRWQLCNQYILRPPVSSITFLKNSQCLINLALYW